MELLASAATKAIDDAGLSLSDIDGLCTSSFYHYFPSLTASEYLGLRPKWTSSDSIGGSSFMGHALLAAMALEMGLCNVAIIAYGSNQRTAGGFRSISEPPPFETVYGPRNPITSYALAASRYMHQFGATREHLAEVAVAARKWAKLNPEAFERGDLTIEDVVSARMISDPLGKLDCCLVTDGAAAIVMTRADRAKDGPNKPVHLLGCAVEHHHRMISAMPELTVTAAAKSGPRAFEMAGYKASDMDTVQLYDAFTINTILFLEDLGYCAKGEGKDFVGAGNIAPGGGLPVNTNGGGLSCVHPGMYGLFVMIEAIRQIRGECGERQIDGTKLSVAHGNGGVLSSQVTSVWGAPETV